MAQTITAPVWGNTVQGPNQKQTFADQTTTTSSFQPDNPAQFVICRIAQKTFTAGTGTARPLYYVQAADDSGFTSNVRRLGDLTLERFSGAHGMLMVCALDGAKSYFRIVPVLDGTDAISYDADLVCT